MVGGPSRRSGSGRGTLPGGPEVVGVPTRRSGSGRGTLPKVWKWSWDRPGGLEVVGGPPGGPKEVGRPTRRFGSCREALPQSRVR